MNILVTVVAAVLLGAVGWLLAPTAEAAVGDGSPTDTNIVFYGRWDTTNSAAYVPHFAGAYFITSFTGTHVSLKQRNAIDLYYSIDGKADVYIQNVSGTVSLTPTALASGTHTLRVSYRVVAGSYTGDAVFQGLTLDSGAKTVAPAKPAKLLEFIGDSITVGTTSTKNSLTAYGWLVGEKLKAAHTQIAVGGACLVAASDGCIGMGGAFLRVDWPTTAAAWNFSRYQADAVIINLGTNDSSHGVSSADFQANYITLLKNARAKYPNAAILALQPFIGTRWVTETKAAVAAVNDARTFYIQTYTSATDKWLPDAGRSDSVHPNDAGHAAIAEKLAPIIAEKLATATATSSPTPSASPTPSRTPSPTPTVSPTVSPSASPTLSPTVSPSASPTVSPSASSTVSPAPNGACTVEYTRTGEWGTGAQFDVTITNKAAAISTWALTWTLPAGQTITQSWNATTSQSGTAAKAINSSWNGPIASGGTASFGFITTGTQTTASGFALNGTACTATA
jgi:lysophospholipase L1-like esterase